MFPKSPLDPPVCRTFQVGELLQKAGQEGGLSPRKFQSSAMYPLSFCPRNFLDPPLFHHASEGILLTRVLAFRVTPLFPRLKQALLGDPLIGSEHTRVLKGPIYHHVRFRAVRRRGPLDRGRRSEPVLPPLDAPADCPREHARQLFPQLRGELRVRFLAVETLSE